MSPVPPSPGAGGGVPPSPPLHMLAENAASATRNVPEAQPLIVAPAGGMKLTFHQPAAGVVDGPAMSATVAPQGMAVSIAALVPTPLRRLSSLAVTRAMPPGVSVAPPSEPLLPSVGSPSGAPGTGAPGAASWGLDAEENEPE